MRQRYINTLRFLRFQEKLLKESVTFISLDIPYSTHLDAVATFENERQKEHQRQGIAAAKKASKYKVKDGKELLPIN